MMKKLLTIFILLLFGYTGTVAQQQNDLLAAKHKLLQGIKKEKLRKPVPLSTQEQVTENKLTKKTRAFDTKVSNLSSGNEEGEAQICINPNNDNQLVMSYMENTSTGSLLYPVYFSTNGGSSWTKSNFSAYNLLSTQFPGYFLVGGGDPVFAWDKSGNLYFSWIYLMLNSSFDTAVAAMHWAKSTDGGSTFTLQSGNNRFIGKSYLDPNSPDFDPLPGSEGFYDRQWLAVDNSGGTNNGRLYCSFIYFNAPSEPNSLTGSTIKILNSSGTAFGNKIQAASGAIQFNNVRVDHSGVLHLTGANVDFNSVIYCKSTDGGTTFSAPITIANGTNLFGSQGNGFIHDRENSAVNMEVDGAKNVHVVWSDFSVNPDSNFNSFYSRLNQGGSSFTTPLDLRTIFPSGQRILMPVVSTHGNRVTIGAYVVNAQTKTGDYYIVNSDNNGMNWFSPVKISAAGTNFSSGNNAGGWFGDYFNSVRTDTKVYNVWSDGRGSGGPKMYVSTYSLWPNQVTDLTPVNSSLQLDKLYPNPASDDLKLQIRAEKNMPVHVRILSLDGKTVINQIRKVDEGLSTIQIPIQTLPNASYVLHLETPDGFKITRHFNVGR